MACRTFALAFAVSAIAWANPPSAPAPSPAARTAAQAASFARRAEYKEERQANPHIHGLYGGFVKPDASAAFRAADGGLDPLAFTIQNPAAGDEYKGPGSDARIASFESPSIANNQGQARWRGPGDTVKFQMKVQWGDGKARPDALPFAPAVHTNMHASGEWRDYPMRFVRQEGGAYVFEADVPAEYVAQFRATGVLTPRSGPERGKAIHWAGHDVLVRPYDVGHDRQSASKVSVMNLGREGIGTFEDMLGEGAPGTNGRYTLQHLAREGFNAVELNPIQPRTSSPYSPSALFMPWANMSKPAQAVLAELDKAKASGAPRATVVALEKRAARLAARSFKTFVDEAHGKGIKVIVDVVRNHIGTSAAVNDVVFYDASGKEIDIFDPAKEGQAVAFSVRRNDVRGVTGAGQAISVDEAKKRMDAAEAAGEPISLQNVTPYVFGKYGDPHGAQNAREIEAGGWGMWPGDTHQLNTGAQMRKGPHGEYLWTWDDMPETKENTLTRSYLRRELALWVLLGVDGFRFDHAQGTPTGEWENGYNQLARVAWAYRRANLYFNAEDWNMEARTKPRVDTLELGGARPILNAKNPGDLRMTYDGYVGVDRERTVAGNHDEGFGNTVFQNPQAYALRVALNELMGGPSLTKFGDERTQTGEERYFMDPNMKPWALTHSNDVVERAAHFSAIMRGAKRDLPALHGREHDWLKRTDDSWDGDIFAVARLPDDGAGPMVLGFGNFNGAIGRQATFRLTSRVAQRLDDGKHYMAFSVGDMKAAGATNDTYHEVWPSPKSGSDLKSNGIWVDLTPNELQALELREVRQENGRWVPVDRGADTPREIRRGAVTFDRN